LTVLGDVINSDVDGSGTIAEATTLVMGDRTTPANSTQDQTISGNIKINQLYINKTGGINNIVQLDGSIDFSANGDIIINNGDLVLTSTAILKGQTGSLDLTINSGGKLETGGQSLSILNSVSASSGTIEFNGDPRDGSENLPPERLVPWKLIIALA
jgi:hypothetical protein